MASLVRAWPCAVSALLLLAAFPPFNLNLLALVALAPWMLSLRTASGWGALRSGLTFGFLYMAGQLWWLQPLTAKWTGSFALSLVPLIIGPLVTMGFFGLAGWSFQVAWRKNWPLLIPLLWAGTEVFRSYCPGLAFPWGQLGTPLWPYPSLTQLAWFGGLFLVSAWVALANLTASQILGGESFARVRSGLIVFVFLGVGASMRLSSPDVGAKTAITIGQLGIDLAFGDRSSAQNQLGHTIETFRGSALANGSRLLILPEGILRAGNAMPPPIPFGTQGNIPILFGGQRGTKPTYQSAFAYDGKWQFADKTRLVVFGEYVPGRDFLPFLEAFHLPSGDLTPGEKVSSLTIGDIRVGPLLCFEGLFPDVASAQAKNDVQLLAILALDDWYFGTSAPDQLRASAVFRAIETGLPVARAAPLGYSMAVDAKGRMVAEAPTGKPVPMRVELVLPAHPDRFPGVDAFRYLALISLAVPFVLVRRLSKPSAESPP